MKEYITPHTVANAVRMNRLAFAGTFLIVEGDKDARLFKNYIDRSECRIELAFGKHKAISAIGILENDGFPGVLTIVDSDFDRLEGITYASRNVLVTDYHDSEIMLLLSSAFEKVLLEFGSEAKWNQFQQHIKQDLRTFLFTSSSIVGAGRLASARLNLGLRFFEVAFGKFVDETSLEINLPRMIKTLKDHSNKLNLNDSEFINEVEQILNERHDALQLCCGHDVVNVLSIGLRKAIGSNNTTDIRLEILERSLRLGFDEASFKGTALYQEILRWQNDNLGFRVVSTQAELPPG